MHKPTRPTSGAWRGQHALKAGLQFDRRSNNVDKGMSANRINLFWDAAIAGQRGRYGYYRVASNPIEPKRGQFTFGDVSDTTVGLFMQDAWTVSNRLTVNVGLRTENETVPFYSSVGSGIQPIHFSFGNKLAPRAGAAWDVAGDGQWKVHGSWGVFYDIFKLSMPQASFGGVRFTIYAFNLETYDWPSLVSSPDCPPACPGGQALVPLQVEPSFENIDPDLEPMRMQELTLGIDHQLSPHVAVSARFVHKQLDQAVEDIGSVDADGSRDIRDRQPWVPPRDRGDSRRSLSQGGSRLRCHGAGRSEAAGSQLGAHGELRVEPFIRQLLGLSESDENGRTDPNHGMTFDAPLALFDGDGRAALRAVGHGPPASGQGAADLHRAVRCQHRPLPIGGQRAAGQPLDCAEAGHRSGHVRGSG